MLITHAIVAGVNRAFSGSVHVCACVCMSAL